MEPSVEHLQNLALQGVVYWERYRGKMVAKVVRWACMWVKAWEVLSEVAEAVLKWGDCMQTKQEEEEEVEEEALKDYPSFLMAPEKGVEGRLQMIC